MNEFIPLSAKLFHYLKNENNYVNILKENCMTIVTDEVKKSTSTSIHNHNF